MLILFSHRFALDDFTSHSYDTLQSFVSAVRSVFEETVPKTMVKKCKKTKA